MQLSITLIITVITCGVSLLALQVPAVMEKLIFNPVYVSQGKQYYRFLTSGFVHADFMHLGFNMLSFYSFGQALENFILSDYCVFGTYGKLVYVVLYLSAIVASELPSYFKHIHNANYYSLGASGGVTAAIFVCVLFFPQIKLGLLFLPIPIPGYIFCILFLVISAYIEKQYNTRVNHMAHIFGALYGVIFIIIASMLIGNINVFDNFIQQVKMPLNQLRAFSCK